MRVTNVKSAVVMLRAGNGSRSDIEPLFKGARGHTEVSVIVYVVLGLVVLVGTTALYFGKGGELPSGLQEWANFGTYVAGIAGPLLSFVALVAVARTLQLQTRTLDMDREKQLADQHLRWLDALYSDITDDLNRNVSPDATLRSILDGDGSPENVDEKRLRTRLDDLLKLIAQYCRAVDMYRDNVSEFYDLQIYADRGGHLLDGIKPLHRYLSSLALPTIEFCDMHLRGESERTIPEAMTRTSRGY